MATVKIGIGKYKFLQDLDNFVLHNNVSIICGDGVKVKGNSLLLASISPWLYKLIKEQSHEEEITIITPDIQSENVDNLIRTVQANLKGNTSIECIINENTLKTLFKPNSGIKLPFCKVDLVDIKCENKEYDSKGDGNDKHYECEDDDDIVAQPADYFENDIEPKMFPNGDFQHAVEDNSKDRKNKVKKQEKKEKFCDICNCMVVLIGNATMKKHNKSAHKQIINCPYCQKSFSTKQYLLLHVKKHHALEDSLILCSKCGFSTNSFDEYTKHDKIHTALLCDVCNKMFVDEVGLKIHKNRMHDKISEKAPEMCSYCGNVYKNVKAHISVHHKNKFRKCPDCEYTCKINVSMEKHYQSVHQGRLDKCEDCGKEVKRIEKHKIRGCPARKIQARFECSKCDKTFSHTDGLRRHLKHIHTSIKDKMCTYCDYKTNVGGNLRMHISRVHEGNSKKTGCKYCEKEVLTSSMDWHVKTYHCNMQQIEGTM